MVVWTPYWKSESYEKKNLNEGLETNEKEDLGQYDLKSFIKRFTLIKNKCNTSFLNTSFKYIP